MSLTVRLPNVINVPIEEDVLVSLVDRRMVITLNRPKSLNSLTMPMIKRLYETLKDVKDNQSADLIILKSSSERAFCAGGDILEIKNSVQTNGSMHKMFYIYEYIVDYLIGTFSIPFVSFINGVTIGAGCGLSVNGAFRVSTERTIVSMPEVGVGLFPDAGATYVLPRLPNHLGFFIALTGCRLKGADAYYSGMATHYVNSQRLAEVEQQLLALPFPNEDNVDRLLKSFQPTMPEFTLQSNLEEINRAFSASSLELVLKTLSKSETKFAKDQLTAILKNSPVSLKVTFNQLKLGTQLKFAEVFAIEYRLIQALVAHPNFLEGCRALLIDRDNQPKWIPNDIESVTEADVQRHYQLLPNEFDLSAKI